MGAGAEVALKANVGVTVQTLRHLETLSANLLEAICLGHLLQVPAPEAYAIRKMVVSDDRDPKAPFAPHASADSRYDEVASAVAMDCPARNRHGRILNCKDERREDTPRSPQMG